MECIKNSIIVFGAGWPRPKFSMQSIVTTVEFNNECTQAVDITMLGPINESITWHLVEQ